MLKQTILDYVFPALLEQGKPSMLNGKCSYRAGTHAEPLKCAVGFLIDDDLYDSTMENKSSRYLKWYCCTNNPIWQQAFREEDEFLAELQECHDSAAVDSLYESSSFITLFTQYVKELATKHNLSVKE